MDSHEILPFPPEAKVKKKVLLPLMLLLGAGLSCDMNATRPATTGSIGIVLLTPSGASFLASARDAESATSDLRPIDARASVALTSARLIVTGPTSKTVTSSTAGPAGFVLRADGLAPGTYAVTVEGLANGQVAHFGTASGISVAAGQETPANVTFPVFQPQIPNAAVEDTSDVLRYTVSWQAVQNASSYIVEWSQSPTMTGASSQSVTGATTLDVTVPSEGKWYFTVKAVNPVVASGGLASVAKPVFLFQGVATVTVTPATPSVVAGGTQQMAAEGRDADNGVVSSVTWFWASSNHTVATVSQTGMVTAIAPGTATITAVGKGMPGSTTLTVTPAPLPPATKLAFVSQPTTTVAGQVVSSVQVAVQTAGGLTVTTDDATQVVLSIGTNPGGSTLGGTLSATAVDGIATFSDLTLNKSGSGYVLTAVAAGLTLANSTGFSIVAGTPNRLGFSIQPTNSIAGDALSPAVQVEIRDQFDNLVTTARDEITIAFGNNAGAGTLTGTKKVNAINGIASFTGLWINKMGTGYTLAATATGLTSATSTGFNISPAAPFKLAFSQQPTNVHGNAAVAPAVTVTIADQFDNATTATSSITLALLDNPWKTPFAPGATLAGTLTNAANNGVASFSTLRIDKPAPSYTLTATSAGLASATSTAFNVNLTVQQFAVSGNGYHTCAVTLAGPYCWGYNGNGQLGIVTGSTGTDSIPSPVRGGLSFVAVTAGSAHSCGITSAGAAYCWGAGGRLGNNSTASSDVPVAVSGSHVFASISAGSAHTCGITTASATPAEDRQIYCWGANNSGQLGDNQASGTSSLVPAYVAEPLRTNKASLVSSGGSHTCALAGGAAYCWGADPQGQLGDDAAIANKLVPTAVSGALTWSSISAGGNHTCGVLVDNTARCWGYNQYGQLGDGAALPGATQNPTPLTVVGGAIFASISAGSINTCAVSTTGVGYCWGYNGEGALGDDNAPNNSSQRVAVAGGLTFTSIRAGNSYACGLTSAPSVGVFCWGVNWAGQLGSPGTANFKKAPVQMIQ